MTLDNGWMMAMVGMFGVFLIGIWVEARRSLRALLEDDFGVNEIVACEADYDAILTRLEARSRLSQIRSSMTQAVGENQSATVNQTATYGLASAYVPHGVPEATRATTVTERPVRHRLAPRSMRPSRTGSNAGHNRMARHRLPHQPVASRPLAQRPLSHNGFNLG